MTETKRQLIRDGVTVAGLVLLGVGGWMIYPPAGLIAPGLILVYVGIWGIPS